MLKQAGYGPGGKALDLCLTYTQGDSNEQVVATLLKSSLARLNINLSTLSLAWPTQWAKAKSERGQPPEYLPQYWWPDMPDPSTWFTNLLLTEHPPYYNLSYYSNPSLDKQINHVDELTATNPGAGNQLYHTMQVEVLQQAPLQALYNVTTSTQCGPPSPGSSPTPPTPGRLRVQPQADRLTSMSYAGSLWPCWWSRASSS